MKIKEKYGRREVRRGREGKHTVRRASLIIILAFICRLSQLHKDVSFACWQVLKQHIVVAWIEMRTILMAPYPRRSQIRESTCKRKISCFGVRNVNHHIDLQISHLKSEATWVREREWEKKRMRDKSRTPHALELCTRQLVDVSILWKWDLKIWI